MPGQGIERNLITPQVTLREAMLRLNGGIGGVLLVVDSEGAMAGLMTDGDIRRALLSGAVLDSEVAAFMNRDFVAGSTGSTHEGNMSLLTGSIRHMPILDEAGRPVDLISWASIWPLPVMTPSLVGRELAYVSNCVRDGWISSQGEYVSRFEAMFAEYHEKSRALTTCNGTAALHLALVALGIGPGDEVIVPDLTFAASANAVLYCGATPVCCDVEQETWTLDPALLEPLVTPRTRAIMPVHLYGHPCDMDAILTVARKHDLRVIEDCAEALGATYRGKRAGTLGDVGCFSFFANKIMTTGEGGMVLTGDPEIAKHMKVLRDHGMTPGRRYWHEHIGYNYRMTNLQAAIGVAQMERIDELLQQRLTVVSRYKQCLADLAGVTLPRERDWARSVYWLFSILVDPVRAGLDSTALANLLADVGIDTRPLFHPLHAQPPYVSYLKGDAPVATLLSQQGLSLPTANTMTEADVDRVCNAVRSILENHRALAQV